MFTSESASTLVQNFAKNAEEHLRPKNQVAPRVAFYDHASWFHAACGQLGNTSTGDTGDKEGTQGTEWCPLLSVVVPVHD